MTIEFEKQINLNPSFHYEFYNVIEAIKRFVPSDYNFYYWMESSYSNQEYKNFSNDKEGLVGFLKEHPLYFFGFREHELPKFAH